MICWYFGKIFLLCRLLHSRFHTFFLVQTIPICQSLHPCTDIIIYFTHNSEAWTNWPTCATKHILLHASHTPYLHASLVQFLQFALSGMQYTRSGYVLLCKQTTCTLIDPGMSWVKILSPCILKCMCNVADAHTLDNSPALRMASSMY
jgi:hypothetical protein